MPYASDGGKKYEHNATKVVTAFERKSIVMVCYIAENFISWWEQDYLSRWLRYKKHGISCFNH
jgi:hypothetical protein